MYVRKYTKLIYTSNIGQDYMLGKPLFEDVDAHRGLVLLPAGDHLQFSLFYTLIIFIVMIIIILVIIIFVMIIVILA